MSEPPRTAKELLALVESHLANLPAKERSRFWSLVTEHKDNGDHRGKLAALTKIVERAVGTSIGAGEVYVEETNDLTAKLNKHRKPTTMAERDAEIMRLKSLGKKQGEIVNLMRKQYPEITTTKVRSAIRRARGKRDGGGS